MKITTERMIPIEYYKRFVGKRVMMLLIIGVSVEGMLVSLDETNEMAEVHEDRHEDGPRVAIVDLSYVIIINAAVSDIVPRKLKSI